MSAGRVSAWKLLQSCHALRNEMAHLCGQLQAYLMFEVLERAWLELTARLASVTHLDDLIGSSILPASTPHHAAQHKDDIMLCSGAYHVDASWRSLTVKA